MLPTPSLNAKTPLVKSFVEASAERLRDHARRVPVEKDAPVVSDVLEALGRRRAPLRKAGTR